MPVWKAKEWEGCLSRSASFEYRVRVGILERGWYENLFDGKSGWGFPSLFDKTWEKIVHEKSAYFPGDQIMVEVGMRLPSKGEQVK